MISFGTLMTRGFGFNTLNTTLLQIPYGLCQTLFMWVHVMPRLACGRQYIG
jgi:hypothetical protein